MCQERILQRLRSRHAKPIWRGNSASKKIFFGSAVQQVIAAVKAKTWPNHQDPREVEHFQADSFLDRAKAFLDLLNKIDDDNTILSRVANIKSLITEANGLARDFDLRGMIGKFTSKELDPTLGEGFVTRLEKLSRYYESAKHLSRLAKRLTALRLAQVCELRLDDRHFARIGVHSQSLRLEDCLYDCLPKEQREDLDRVLSQLRTEYRRSGVTFPSRFRSANVTSKVHAEIQILCHYELHPARFLPRVICSSKDACYMCNTFVRAHEKFYIPKTHGKVYPSWRLPSSIPSLAIPNRVFCDIVRQQILEEFKLRIQSGERLKMTHPNESTLFPLKAFDSLSTLRSPAADAQSRPENFADSEISYHTSTTASPVGASSVRHTAILPDAPSTISSMPTIEESVAEEEATGRPKGDNKPDPSKNEDKKDVSNGEQHEDVDLTVTLARGESMSWPLKDPAAIRSVATPFLILYPECVSGSISPTTEKSHEIIVTWLELSEARVVREQGVRLIDASLLSTQENLDSGSKSSIYFVHADEILRVQIK